MELLVVMAISMILMALVMAPVVRSFQLTRRAQAMVEAQDAARIAMEQITREIGEAMDVLDYTAEVIELPVYDPNASEPYWLPMPFAKIDLIMPRMIVHCNNLDHDPDEPRDFERGDLAAPNCPVCGSQDVEIKPRLPIEQGNTVVRYFLGLKYNNPNPASTDIPPNFGWQSPWGNDVLADEGNQVVLYRLEFDPNNTDIFGNDPDEAARKLMDVLKDPQFFYRDTCPRPNGTSWAAADGRELWRHWAEKARVLGIAKYQDLVTCIDTDNDGVFEAARPSVAFRYAKVDNDTLVGLDHGNTASELTNAPPTTYRAKFGYWTPNSLSGVTMLLGVAAYRYGQLADGTIDTSTTAHYYTTVTGSGDLAIYRSVGNSSPSEVFNITQYMNQGRLNPNSMDPNTDMAFYFDYAGQLMNFNRGTVNFALNVVPMVLSPGDIADINMNFAVELEQNRNPIPRWCRLAAMNVLRNAMVVPGSEVVMGPDMTPGAPNGRMVRYARIPRDMGTAGLNEYQINYSTGDMFFSRLKDQDLPETGSIQIDYKIQFNQSDDVVIATYYTKSLIDVYIGIRMFDPDSGKPHMVELNDRAQVRNAFR